MIWQVCTKLWLNKKQSDIDNTTVTNNVQTDCTPLLLLEPVCGHQLLISQQAQLNKSSRSASLSTSSSVLNSRKCVGLCTSL